MVNEELTNYSGCFMPLILARIDDRLIHGQVVVGWGNYLKPNRIILCSDSVAETPWQKELFEVAGTLAPGGVDISIWTESETIEYFDNEDNDREKVILLVETPHELFELIEGGVPVEIVNIGGMHFKPGKQQLAPYIFVNDEDIEYFKKLRAKSIHLVGQDVPTAKKIDLAKTIDFI